MQNKTHKKSNNKQEIIPPTTRAKPFLLEGDPMSRICPFYTSINTLINFWITFSYPC